MSRKPNSQDDSQLRGKLRLLPAAPGVYLHKDRQGKVIYVGKAKRLNARVRSYFQDPEGKDAKTQALVRKIQDFDYIATETETDALVLENQLIKEYRPQYNVRLKDDKQYPYLRISLAEDYPRITVVRRIEADGARYFGPYTNAWAMRETLKFTAGFFQVRTCSFDLPDAAVDRPCLDYQIGRCTAPCVDEVDRQQYGEQIEQLIAFLEGRDRSVVEELTRRMEAFSEDLRFEDAATLRDRVRRLETTVAESKFLPGVTGDADVCGLVRDGEEACGVVLRVRGGRIRTTHHFLMRDRFEEEPGVFQAHLLREYYPRAGDIPPLVLMSHDMEDMEQWTEWLARLRDGAVSARVPQRGAKREAVELAMKNAAFKLSERALRDVLHAGRSIDPGDVALQEALGLHKVPETIECFDISNFQGKETVASLVTFKGGEPLKSRYRRFRIRTVEGVDDFASMEEVLERHYGKLAAKEERPADLVVVDGGIGQLGRARAVLARHGFGDTDLIGLAKRDEIIVRESGELKLSRKSPALKLLQRVRDEAHRFAITYHRLLRDQRTTASALDLIPGIGQVKKLSLLHHFGSVEAIREAGPDDLSAVRGLGRQDAVNIMTFFEEQRKQGGRE